MKLEIEGSEHRPMKARPVATPSNRESLCMVEVKSDNVPVARRVASPKVESRDDSSQCSEHRNVKRIRQDTDCWKSR